MPQKLQFQLVPEGPPNPAFRLGWTGTAFCTLLKSGVLIPVLIFPAHTLCASLEHSGPSQCDVHLMVLHALESLSSPNPERAWTSWYKVQGLPTPSIDVRGPEGYQLLLPSKPSTQLDRQSRPHARNQSQLSGSLVAIYLRTWKGI